MSRAYRIQVSESVKRNISAADEMTSVLEILEVLPAEQMRGLLREELLRRGFLDDGEELVRDEGNGIVVRVDARNGQVTVRSEKAESVELSDVKEVYGYDDVGPTEDTLRRRLQEQIQQDLDRKVEQQRERVQAQVTEKLEGHMDDIRKDLGDVVNRVTVEALKRKAASLGQIKEMTEDPQTGSLTIKVEV